MQYPLVGDLLRWFNLTSNKTSFDRQNLTEKKSLFLARKNVPKAAVFNSIGSGGIDPPYARIAASLAVRGFVVGCGRISAWLCVCVCWCWWASIHQKNSAFYPIKTPFFALFYVFLCHLRGL
ncbi:TPA: hypothetical protein JFV33_002477 [Salmonella enterica]|nr:hypothetical protein [Salmonella enterica]